MSIGFDSPKSSDIFFIVPSEFGWSHLVKTIRTFDLSTFSSPSTCLQAACFILISSKSSDASIRSKIRSAASDSSSVDLNASTMYVGSLLIKPTVSVSKVSLSCIFNSLVVVDSVVKSLLEICLSSPVSELKRVVFPELV